MLSQVFFYLLTPNGEEIFIILFVLLSAVQCADSDHIICFIQLAMHNVHSCELTQINYLVFTAGTAEVPWTRVAVCPTHSGSHTPTGG